MRITFNKDNTLKGFVIPETPQELQRDEFSIVIKNQEIIEKIQNGATPRWNPESEEVEIDESTIEIPREELYEMEFADLWFDNMTKELQLLEQEEEIAELWFMLMMLGGAD